MSSFLLTYGTWRARQEIRNPGDKQNPGQPKQVYNCDNRNPRVTIEETPRSHKKGIRVPDIPHNLITGCELVDAECGVHLYKHSAEIEF